MSSFGGGKENRTPDPLLAKQVLSQLSYTPIILLLRHNNSCFGHSFSKFFCSLSLRKIFKKTSPLQIKTTFLGCFYYRAQLSYTPIFCHLFRICPPSLRLMYPMYTAAPFAEQLRKI